MLFTALHNIILYLLAIGDEKKQMAALNNKFFAQQRRFLKFDTKYCLVGIYFPPKISLKNHKNVHT